MRLLVINAEGKMKESKVNKNKSINQLCLKRITRNSLGTEKPVVLDSRSNCNLEILAFEERKF